jgi:hypothetical protein
MTPVDCPMSTSSGSHGHSMLDHLIRGLLGSVFNKEKADNDAEEEEADVEEEADHEHADNNEVAADDAEKNQAEADDENAGNNEDATEADDMDDEDADNADNNNDAEADDEDDNNEAAVADDAEADDEDEDNNNDAAVANNYLEEEPSDSGGAEEFNSMKDNIGFFPGIIKTGRASVHQDLHIDNSGLLGTPFLESVLAGEFDSITPLQRLEAGCVVDMPLSREGAFLRIAVPDPVYKVFVMKNWLFIPFGSFVVRSNALFHSSGHYGSPGNTRLHAMDSTKVLPQPRQQSLHTSGNSLSWVKLPLHLVGTWLGRKALR